MPAQRTLERCRKWGWTAQKVETWVPIEGMPGGGVRRDLFGFIDVLALDGKPGCLGIQATSGSNVAGHMHKLLRCPEDERHERAWLAMVQAMRQWIAADNRLEIWGWRKVGKAGARKLWEPRILQLELGQIPAGVPGKGAGEATGTATPPAC